MTTATSKPALLTALLLAAIFASGVLTGLAVARRGAAEGAQGRVLVKEPPRDNGIPLPLTRLGLTADQERRMREIAARWQPRVDSIMRVLLPEIRAINHGMFQEMVCILTPTQDSAYLAWRTREGLNQAEGEEQMTRVRDGTCPAPGPSAP